ncbi:YT521-B-like domain-containing protein [Lactarius quietus]|nr:YT521-B-like domain-containing protein [Lactarius quietus]
MLPLTHPCLPSRSVEVSWAINVRSRLPCPLGSPIPEENIHQSAYISPSMMTMIPPHAPVYQYRTPPDLVPTPPSQIFSSSVSAPTSPIYPHHLTNTSPLPNSPTILRHSLSGPLRSVHHSPPNAMPGAYTPMGYTYAYPSPASFVPAPSIYGSHSPPSHYTQPYSFPTGQENQGMWWYSPPGSITPLNPVGGAQREFQPQVSAGYPPVGQFTEEPPGHRNTPSLSSRPQPTRRLTNRTRVGRPLNDANEEAPRAPSLTSRNQERRSYHPNPPAHRSDWVMWAGNVPANVTQDELREFFDQLPEDREHVYGGVLTVFLISRSNCAFVNFESEAQLEAATARFNGQSIRPDDQRCPRLVCRVRRKEDDLMAGVGAQRGSGMHIKWVKEQRARVQREQAGTVGSPRDMSDLDLSVQKNIWATQRHNEEILDQAYRTSKDVFLIFSVNKSGEFFGYARMAGLVLRDESGMPWRFATGFTPPPSESSSSENGAGSSPSPDDTGVEPQDPLYNLPPDVRPVVAHAPHSAPAGRPSFLSAEPHKPYDRHHHPGPMRYPIPSKLHRPLDPPASRLDTMRVQGLTRFPKLT